VLRILYGRSLPITLNPGRFKIVTGIRLRAEIGRSKVDVRYDPIHSELPKVFPESESLRPTAWKRSKTLKTNRRSPPRSCIRGIGNGQERLAGGTYSRRACLCRHRLRPARPAVRSPARKLKYPPVEHGGCVGTEHFFWRPRRSIGNSFWSGRQSLSQKSRSTHTDG
jgi:hypothetical protein